MDSVYRFAFFSFLSFSFAVNLASTYKEVIMEDLQIEDLELRDRIMGFILDTLREVYDDIPESDIEAISDIDAILCKRLGLDIDSIPPFD